MQASFHEQQSSIADESGRKKDIVKAELFEQLCEWLETADDLYTVSELHEKLQELAGSTVKIYSEKWLQQMLVDKYKDHIFFAQISGRNNVVCFKDVASTIISDKWCADRKSNIDDESERIVIAAAELIKAEIRNAKYSMESYPAELSYW
jgi:hypothetical protein